MKRIRISRRALALAVLPSMLVLILGSSSPVSAASRVIWQHVFATSGGNNAFWAVANAPDGSAIYATGVLRDPNTHADGIETIAYDPASGNTLWEARYFGGFGYDIPSSVTVSPDGLSVYIVGSTQTTTNLDWLVVAYSASDGTQRWVQTYDGVNHENDSATGVAVSPDNATVFVTGGAWEGTHPITVPTTAAYGAARGDELWRTTDETAHYGQGSSIAVSPDGSRVDVSGSFYGNGGNLPLTRTWSFDSATGAESWRSTFLGAPGGNSMNGMKMSPDGSRLYLTAQVFSGTGYIAVFSLDASTGAQVWKVQTDGPARLGASPGGLDVTPDGSQILIGGDVNRAGKQRAFFLWSIASATGAPQWKRVYQRKGDSYDAAYLLAISPDGASAYVTGIACASLYCNLFARSWLTTAYSLPDGVLKWTARFGSANADNRAGAIVVTPDSTKLVVVGDSYSTNLGDRLAVIAYGTG